MIFLSRNVFRVLIILYVDIVYSYGLNKTTFVIMSQKPQSQIAANTKLKLYNSLKQSGIENPNIYSLDTDLTDTGGWTIFPILKPLMKMVPVDNEWFLFLNEHGSVDPVVLEELLARQNHDERVFLGKALHDKHPVIIHYFDTNLNLKYPDFSAGFVMSKALIKDIITQIDTTDILQTQPHDNESFRGNYVIGKDICAFFPKCPFSCKNIKVYRNLTNVRFEFIHFRC